MHKAVALAVLLLAVGWPSSAHAYPWMIRHGYGGCTTCHTDPSGAGMLTPYGRAQGDLLLRMHYGGTKPASKAPSAPARSFDSFDSFDESGAKPAAPAPAPEPEEAAGPAPSAGFLWGLWDPPDWLLLGGSYRHLTVFKPSAPGTRLATFPMQADLYAELAFGDFSASASVGAIRVPAGSPHARAAQVTTNQGDQWNMISRTHWLGYTFDRGQLMLRAGRIELPFGIRIPEHTMWVRDQTRTDRDSDQQHGVALAYNGDVLRGELMLIAGNYQINPDRFRERGYSGYLELIGTDRLGLGASSLVTVAAADVASLELERTVREAHGVFARYAPVEPLVVLFEADALVKSRREPGYTGFLQLDYEVVQGFHLGTTGEVLDAGYENHPASGPLLPRARGYGKPRFGGWLTVDWFFLPHLEMRVDAVARQDDPFTLLGQFHAYL